jgi:hypothetical protein
MCARAEHSSEMDLEYGATQASALAHFTEMTQGELCSPSFTMHKQDEIN